MSELVTDCPRCGAKKITFDLGSTADIKVVDGWQNWCEAFCVCRRCERSTVFVLSQKSKDDSGLLSSNSLQYIDRAVDQVMDVERYISAKDFITRQPPDHIPSNVEAAFREGAACMTVGCFNAAGAMFRLSIDLSTKSMLPTGDTEGLNKGVRRSLGFRLKWLFQNNHLPKALKDLSTCIKEDGNDGAHDGTLSKQDAEDIVDFTYILLDRIYTEPKKIELVKKRREDRRNTKT